MDVRVLVAVFVTLLAVAIGMNQGHIDADQLLDQIRELRAAGDSLNDLLEQRNKKASNISISADLETGAAFTLLLRTPATARFDLAPGTRLRVGDSSLSTVDEERVSFDRFTGTVRLGQANVTVEGRAWGVSTATISFNYSEAKPVRVRQAEADAAALRWVSRQDLQFQNVTGTVESSGPEISLKHDSAVLQTFMGNITMTRPGKYLFDGTVSAAVLGTGTPPIQIGPR